MNRELFTIGHSTRDLAEFLDVLYTFEIDTVVDVRSMPGSRLFPHFNQETLKQSLAEEGITYSWLKELGGRRGKDRTGVPFNMNNGWSNHSFQNYCDHMQTGEFDEGIKKLVGLIGQGRCAIMCAEVCSWRCHRKLIADKMLTIGYKVVNIMDMDSCNDHVLTNIAKVRNGIISYPKPKGKQ